MIHMYDQNLPDGTVEVFGNAVEDTDTPQWLGHSWPAGEGFKIIEEHADCVFSHKENNGIVAILNSFDAGNKLCVLAGLRSGKYTVVWMLKSHLSSDPYLLSHEYDSYPVFMLFKEAHVLFENYKYAYNKTGMTSDI